MSGIGPRGKVAIFVAPRGIHQTPLAPSDTGQTKKRFGSGFTCATRPLSERDSLREVAGSRFAGEHASTRGDSSKQRGASANALGEASLLSTRTVRCLAGIPEFETRTNAHRERARRSSASLYAHCSLVCAQQPRAVHAPAHTKLRFAVPVVAVALSSHAPCRERARGSCASRYAHRSPWHLSTATATRHA